MKVFHFEIDFTEMRLCTITSNTTELVQQINVFKLVAILGIFVRSPFFFLVYKVIVIIGKKNGSLLLNIGFGRDFFVTML